MNATSASILGTGNAALAAAYHFSREGREICLFGAAGYDQALDEIAKQGGIRAAEVYSGIPLVLSGFSRIEKLTRSIAEAAAFSDLIILPVPSFAQIPIFDMLLPHLRMGHIIVCMPGNYGALALRHRARQAGYTLQDISFIDASTVPWATRILGPAQIAVFGLKKKLPISALNGPQKSQALDILSQFLPLDIKIISNVIQSALENINFGGHPLPTICSLGLLENYPDHFNFYADCTSPSVARAAERLDAERLRIGTALGLALSDELDLLNDLYGTRFPSVEAFNRNSSIHVSIKQAPQSSETRYLTEDVPYLLVPSLELAELTGVDTPTLRACIDLASALTGKNFRNTGRKLFDLGVSHNNLDFVLESFNA